MEDISVFMHQPTVTTYVLTCSSLEFVLRSEVPVEVNIVEFPFSYIENAWILRKEVMKGFREPHFASITRSH